MKEIRSNEKSMALGAALNEITFSKAYFSREDLLRKSLEHAQGRGLSASDVMSAVDLELEHSQELVSLGIVSGHERFTTQEMLDIEKQLFADVEAIQKKKGHVVEQGVVDRAIGKMEAEKNWDLAVDAVAEEQQEGKPFQKPEFALSTEQRNALQHLTLSRGGMKIVSGMAGAGKTTVMKAAKMAWDHVGYNAIGVTLSNRAARELEDTERHQIQVDSQPPSRN